MQLGKKKEEEEEGESGGVEGSRGGGGSADPRYTPAMSSWVVVTGKQMQVHDDSWVVCRVQTSN